MKNELNKNKKKGLSKRGKLFLVIALSAILLLIFGLFDYWLVSDNWLYIIIKYVIIQIAITIALVAVYYLTIIADVMSKQNERAEKDRQLRENEKNNK